jgi:hypothetical protein
MHRPSYPDRRPGVGSTKPFRGCEETIFGERRSDPETIAGQHRGIDQTKEFGHVDGSQPDLSPVLLGPLDGDAQVSSLDGPLMRKA